MLTYKILELLHAEDRQDEANRCIVITSQVNGGQLTVSK
jgi:hypothetical protein